MTENGTAVLVHVNEEGELQFGGGFVLNVVVVVAVPERMLVEGDLVGGHIQGVHHHQLMDHQGQPL